MPPEIQQMLNEPGLTSDQAAALIMSGGRTKDAQAAEMIVANERNELNMDKLQRAHLRRLMGFDFKIKSTRRKYFISAKDNHKIRVSIKIRPGDVDERGNIVNEDFIARLVGGCLALKNKWEEYNEGRET